MPQMAPMNWTLLFFFTMFLFLCIVVMFFYLSKYKLKNPVNKNIQKMKYVWKW
uniref:ATP synthase F0 subunit 8 n=1 Tax=Trigonopterus selaruensis TaxID=2678945 RepID=A0A7H1KHQ4_9CUCU|nr:ATP synthase F0 subunit 8 [Trigonopterus selaruensis]QNT26820.1 ATP synthase F0 subunit 8 [Trigonopterus selaruensis]